MSDLGALRSRLTRVTMDFSQAVGEAKAVAQQRNSAAAAAESERAMATALEEACAVLTKYADTRQEHVRTLIEGLVTKGLREVFEDDLTFHVRTKQVGRRTDTYFTIASGEGDDAIETDILSARGGGVASVTGFLLRVIFIMLHKAPRVLFLDESFAQVSENFEPRLAEFIDTLCEEYGLRIVLVTHSQNPVWADIADAVYTSSITHGLTNLERTK